jgi:hypothetical protein
MALNLGGTQGLSLILAAFQKLTNKVDGIHESIIKSVDVSLANFKLQSESDLERLLALAKSDIVEMVEERLLLRQPALNSNPLVTPQAFAGGSFRESSNSISSMSAFSLPSRPMQATEDYLLEEFNAEDASWATQLSSEKQTLIDDESAIHSVAVEVKATFITDMRFSPFLLLFAVMSTHLFFQGFL